MVNQHERRMTYNNCNCLNIRYINAVFSIIIIILFQQNLIAQTVGLHIEKKAPPQYFVEKKHFQLCVNQYLIKRDSLKPSKIPSVFSVEALPFFCKIEYKMGLQKKLPLKFRLGDVQYVDELERKRNN
jgi:hypothetical protein